MKKIVIIINGRGEVGKDTLCDITAKYFRTMNVSSITPIKEIAGKCGWSGEKNDRSRKFLSDLKKLMTDYNDFPTLYLLDQYSVFLASDAQIMFVQIREGEEIDKFKEKITGPCCTLLIKRSSQDMGNWGNDSDDQVELYQYDYIFDNCKSLQETEEAFRSFISDIFSAMHGINIVL